ncbi:hypothetical protein HHK36_004147 [Tetracentron sinense]|uniref:Peptidase M14 domain-containing protein n=1 Tax=Tetracentron sinense TaxID=13715 RepID=A0A834ZQD3_TETSI|nr:hypothetical protein HHK36_004147 [Tetracentron sinense]
MEFSFLPTISLLVLAFCSSFLLNLTPAIARGGELGSNLSGSTDYNSAFFGRHLFEDKQTQSSVDVARGYMSNSELEKAVKDFGQRCSNISRIYSIGKSVKGVPLWVMEISDKPGEKEAEPAFKFIGNVHGDEPVGRELLLLLANWLCNNYMKDPLATLIIKNVHLHILPTMNPDGFSLRRRGNANKIDLNRDFPDPVSIFVCTFNSLIGKSEDEGFDFHSCYFPLGALVANYPWDGSQDTRKHYYACPDDKTFRYMASVYSRSHYNMSLSKEFEGGITNGALWYPIYGGMQDWNYIHAGCFELTLEISDFKWPNAKELPTLWEFNRMSMLNLVASLVKVKADSPFADYHRMLAPGESYEVMATMPGYKSKTTHFLLENEAASVDFILDPKEEDPRKWKQLQSGFDCNCDSKSGLELIEFLGGTHLKISIGGLLVLLFLCFLLKRKMKFNLPRQSVGPKRVGLI